MDGMGGAPQHGRHTKPAPRKKVIIDTDPGIGYLFPLSHAIRAHHGVASCANLVDYAQVDAFTNEAFKGNPAAVCLLPSPRTTKWMQNVAMEFSAPMTAFLVKRPSRKEEDGCNGHQDGASEAAASGIPVDDSTMQNLHLKSEEKASEYYLRWFTPTVEVELCGHATLASAYLLFASAQAVGSVIVFHTKSGALMVRKVMTGGGGEKWHGKVELSFPIVATAPVEAEAAAALPQTLDGRAVVSAHKTSAGDLLLELKSAADVAALEPQRDELLQCDARGLLITAKGGADSPYDFVSRFFAPKLGLPEDPVCGSGHCALAPLWASKLKKTDFVAYQASKRGGALELRVDDVAGRVFLQGTAVIITVGILLK